MRLLLLLRLAFWVALCFAVTMAVLPHPPDVGEIGDKWQHMLAFTTLTVLGIVAYPATPLGRIGERLSFLGALIEVVQSIPALHRDCDILDWVADTAVVLGVIGVVLLVGRGRPRWLLGSREL